VLKFFWNAFCKSTIIILKNDELEPRCIKYTLTKHSIIMKKIHVVLGAFLTLFLVACEGPPGFDGLDGRDGRDGLDGIDAPLSKVIDIEGTFDFANDYAILFEFPDTIEVFETDIVLVYLLFDQTEDSNGDPVDIWRLLPQTLIVDQGLLQYNYDHTFLDVNIFLETDFDTALLTAGDTDNQVFRIAVLPAESTGKLDTRDIDAVMDVMGVKSIDVKRIKL